MVNTKNTWNWQKTDWPKFTWDSERLKDAEARFLHNAGLFQGTLRHMDEEERADLTIEVIGNEAYKTSEIEGEYLDRASLQSSLRRNFGLEVGGRRLPAPERGIADMMSALYRGHAAPLDKDILCAWHKMVMAGRGDIQDIGRYRTHPEPMQVVSGAYGHIKVHFEAPPSASMDQEMEQFLKWFAATAPDGAEPLPALTRAGLAHFWFVCIHPFEDGNGRVGRAIAELALSQALGRPTLIALSHLIEKRRAEYYRILEESNKGLELPEWLAWFAEIVLAAQEHSQALIDFLIEKTKLLDRVRDRVNERQMKVLLRMFREGPEGFMGGLSAENYISITGTSRATATRDLTGLVNIGALYKTGERKSTRYYLTIGKEA